jgi:hypothetical protein
VEPLTVLQSNIVSSTLYTNMRLGWTNNLDCNSAVFIDFAVMKLFCPQIKFNIYNFTTLAVDQLVGKNRCK